jgi:HPt (histidine-containing phosphotransfer) domain-containing protein/HAMP domain-containing protein
MKSTIMKSTIWKKIFYQRVLPFSVIYVTLSAFIVYQVYLTQTDTALWLIGASFFVSFVFFLLLFIYLSKGVARPLKKLAGSSEKLALGNLDVQIEVVHSGDEIEMITRSLDRMAEQFRVSKVIQQRYQNRFEIILRIHKALFSANTLDGAFDQALTEIADYFHVYKASMVILRDEQPKICSVYPLVEHDEGEAEFFWHHQVSQLLKGKKHIFMNYGAISAAQLSFVNFETKSLCILPLRVNGILRGYIIIEGKDQESFIHDDTTLIFLGATLSNIIGCRIDWEQMADDNSTRQQKKADYGEILIPEDYEVFLEKAKTIQGLDVDKGILFLGGEKEKYRELLKITLKVINESMKKMRELYMEDIPSFAIEAHGIKSALYTIGADQWGDQAKQLEFAAKSADAGYCSENYPLFEEKLRALSRNLTALFPQQEHNSQNGGNLEELRKALPKIKEAAENYDTLNANSLLIPFVESRMMDGEIQEMLADIEKDLENLEYETADEKIANLQRKLEGKK